MRKIILRAGKFSRLEIYPDFDHVLILCSRGISPTGMEAVSLSFQQIAETGLQHGPEMLFEIGDIAWYPYQYKEPEQLFAECIYRKDEQDRLLVNHQLKRQLIHLAEAWDRELLSLELILKKSS
jgi:hypothetical protein